jgi:hypothetical protein
MFREELFPGVFLHHGALARSDRLWDVVFSLATGLPVRVHVSARIALDAANLVFVLGDDDVSRVSLAFWAKGFYIGSDFVNLIFKHEVHYQSPEFTTTSASNTADCDVQQITLCNTSKTLLFLPSSASRTQDWQVISTCYVLKRKMVHQVEENPGKAGQGAWRSQVPLL